VTLSVAVPPVVPARGPAVHPDAQVPAASSLGPSVPIAPISSWSAATVVAVPDDGLTPEPSSLLVCSSAPAGASPRKTLTVAARAATAVVL